MAVEIERKFLVHRDLLPVLPPGDTIIQGYIPALNRITVRVRVRSGRAWLTLKGASTYDGLVSTELSRPRDGTITRFLPTDEWPVEYTADPEGTGEIIAVLVPAYATPADW